MNPLHDSALGKPTTYPHQYDPTLLFSLARSTQRDSLGLCGTLPFMGADLWTAYELSWLNPHGKPQLALAHISVPCESPCIVESKSLKLYLGSFAATVIASADDVRERLRRDLTQAVWVGVPVGASVGVQLVAPQDFATQRIQELAGLSLDRLDIECQHYSPAPELLSAALHEQPVTEVLTSDLLKSNCPVTGQPDWGSVQIAYSGPQIDQAGLLRYLVSFRNHQEFHEHCIERIYMDIWRRCQPTKLAVYGRYTRRGGLDINPFRTSHPQALPAGVRTARQ